MCTKKKYNFAICGHNEWCESQCQTKMKRVLLSPADADYPRQPCYLVEYLKSKDDPVTLYGECSACRRPYWREAEVVEDSEGDEEGEDGGADGAKAGTSRKGAEKKSAGAEGSKAAKGKAAATSDVDSRGEKIIESIETPERPSKRKFKTLQEAFLAFGNIDSSAAAREREAAEDAAAAEEEAKRKREYVPYPWNIHRTPSGSPELQVIIPREWDRTH